MTKWNWRNPEQAAALNLIRRLAGLDPDGPLVPMQPYVKNEFEKMVEDGMKYTRDAYLCRAVRFT